MLFKTIEEYDKNLIEIKTRLEDMENRFNQNPERIWIKGNHDSLNQIYKIVLKDREEYYKMIEDNTQLHVTNKIKEDLPVYTLSSFLNFLLEFSSSIYEILKNQNNSDLEDILSFQKISSGSLHLYFSMGDERTDLNDVQLNHDIFEALFDFFEAKNEDFKELYDKFGDSTIVKYQEFLNFLIENEFDIVLENSSRKIVLTHNDALRVFNFLKNNKS